MKPEFKTETRTCVVCDSDFTIPYKLGYYNQKTCSHQCREQNNRRIVNRWTRKHRKYKLNYPLTCPVCHDIFYGKRGLGAHKARAHPELPHNCYKCGVMLTQSNLHKNGAIRNLCKNCHNSMSRKQYRKHPEHKLKYTRSVRRQLREEILTQLGGKCVLCGFNDFRALQIDHVNNNGHEEKKRFGSYGFSYYRHVLKKLEEDSQDYQCLCANCNQIKAKGWIKQ